MKLFRKETPKINMMVILTFILALWDLIAPTVEVILGVGSRAFAVISLIITAISFGYNYFFPKESMFKTARRKLGM